MGTIARALLKKAPIILLDEATSALDAKNEEEVMDAILKIVGKCTILMITHKLSTVQNANKIFFMQRGEIVEEGSFNSLLQQNGEFHKLYDIQTGAIQKGQSS